MDDKDLRRLIEEAGQETRRHFDIVAEDLGREIGTLAEAMSQVDEKVDRVESSLHAEMGRGFTETQAMIKFSYAELDRRLRTLEDDVSGLRERVDRLETSSTH